jgi:non-ribosomal peptide synthetase component F
MADRALTYEQLDEMSNAISQAILRHGHEGQRPIALLLDQGIDAVAAMFGALKAGKCYVPLDPSFPISRIRLILEDCQANLVIAGAETGAMAAEAIGSGVRLLNVEDCSPGGDDDQNTISPTPHLILYTSGSTGRPKGVLHTHRTALHASMLLTNLVHLCAEDRIALPLSYSFSASIRYLFGALLNGALILPFNLKKDGFAALIEWLDQQAITVCGLTGSMFRQFLSQLAVTEKITIPSAFAVQARLSNNDGTLQMRLPTTRFSQRIWGSMRLAPSAIF